MKCRLKTYLIILSLLFFSLACGKEEFTKPSELTFSFDFKGESEDLNYLSFTSGQIVLEEFEFQGVRANAPNFFFEEVFEGGLLVEWPGSPHQLRFEIPQGVYSSIEISLKIASDSVSGLLAEGVYERLDDDVVPFILDIDDEISFEIEAESANGAKSIALSNNEMNRASITFEVANFVKNIKRDSLEAASNRAVPAKPADPGNPGEPATPATPANPNPGNPNAPGIKKRNEILISKNRNKDFIEKVKDEIMNQVKVVFD